MTAEEWLEANGKRPWELDPFWYWATLADFDPEDPDDLDFMLPDDLFRRLGVRTTYPNVKMYWSEAEALDDFRQAYEDWRTDERSCRRDGV